MAYSSGNTNVLGKENALSLNDKEVGELVNITDHAVDGVAGDGVVSARAKLRGKAVTEHKLAGGLGGDGNSEGHP